MTNNLDRHGHGDPEYTLPPAAVDQLVQGMRENLDAYDALSGKYGIESQIEKLPSDSEWKDAGPSLGGLMAEAIGAFAIWQSTSGDGDVGWPSGRGYDVVTTVKDETRRIDVKRSWRKGAPVGYFFCAPLSANAFVTTRSNVETFALVLLDNKDLEWVYQLTEAGEVVLQAKAKPSEIYLVPYLEAVRLAGTGDIAPDGGSVARWKVKEDSVTSYRIIR
ncbi:hypothetical protein [Actinoplanes sp. NPDC026619]|uniref:hypothetical protein n=1 Tax=Actinoplanes sp. NPDC026619 TaxID=3155798 RepID=UPI0033F00B93